MSVDIRARVFSDRGEVISGGFSDDHVQGTGLIRCKGEVILKGLISLSTGESINLGYEKGGNIIRMPRALKVLSSFADPFRRQTTVSLGCALTLLENFRENKKTDPLADAANADKPCEEYAKGPAYMRLTHIAQECLSALGIGGSVNLTGSIAAKEFDFSSGYVSILSDLLYSQGLVGFINAGGSLSIRSLNSTGTSAVLNENDVIDVTPISSGEIPPKTVIVDYSYNKFNKPPDEPKDDSNDDNVQKRNWEKDVTQGELQYAYVFYNKGNSVYEHRFYPITVTETKYDALDRVLERKAKTVTAGVIVNSTFCSHFLDETGGINSRFFDVEEITTTKFNYQFAAENLIVLPTALDPCRSYNFSINISTHAYYNPEIHDQVISEVTVKEESDLAIAGAINIPFYFFKTYQYNYQLDRLELNQIDRLLPGTAPYPSEITTVVYETDTEQGISKTITERYLANAYTQPGQQGLSHMAKKVKSIQLAQNILNNARVLVHMGASVQTHVARDFGVQKRPSVLDKLIDTWKKADRKDQEEIEFTENVTLNEVIQGGGAGVTTTYSMPFAPDDIIGVNPASRNDVNLRSFLREASPAPQLAKEFGRIQQKLSYGHRKGFSLQTVPNKLPTYAGDGVVLSLGGINALYMVNAQSWSFDSNGIVASCDLIYMGGIGATSTEYRVPSAWAPVQDGITQLPLAPAVTTTTPIPANSLTTPVGFDPANPGAIFTTLPTDAAFVPEKSMPVTVTLPAYKESITQRLEVFIGLTVNRTLISLPEPDRPALVLTKLGAAVERFVYDVRTLSGGVKTGLTIEQLFNDARTASIGVKVGSSITGEYPSIFDFTPGDAIPVLGSGITTGTPSGWTLLFNGQRDDIVTEVTSTPFPILYNGISYNGFFISPNGYITFGSGSEQYSNLSATNPALPKIMLNAAEDSLQRVLTRSTENTFRVRVEGNTNPSGTGTEYRVYEIAFFRPSAFDGIHVFEVRFGLCPVHTGLFNVYSASALLTTDPAPIHGANKSHVFASPNSTQWYIFPADSVIPVE